MREDNQEGRRESSNPRPTSSSDRVYVGGSLQRVSGLGVWSGRVRQGPQAEQKSADKDCDDASSHGYILHGTPVERLAPCQSPGRRFSGILLGDPGKSQFSVSEGVKAALKYLVWNRGWTPLGALLQADASQQESQHGRRPILHKVVKSPFLFRDLGRRSRDFA